MTAFRRRSGSRRNNRPEPAARRRGPVRRAARRIPVLFSLVVVGSAIGIVLVPGWTGTVASQPGPLPADHPGPGRPSATPSAPPPDLPPHATSTAAFCHGTSSQMLLHLPDRGAPGSSRAVWVYRSPGASVPDDSAIASAGPGTLTETSVPVLYFLHGLPGTAYDLPDAGAAAIFDRLACTLQRPFVVAAPDGNGAAGQDTEWADDAHGGFGVESFVTGPLISAVEGAAVRDRADRAIFGFSMGGYGAVTLALRHPDLYAAAASISGYFKIDDPNDTFGKNEAEHDPDQLLERASAVRLLLAQGAQDDEPVVRGELTRFAGLLTAAGTPPTTLVVPGGHNYALVLDVLPQVVRFLLS